MERNRKKKKMKIIRLSRDESIKSKVQFCYLYLSVAVELFLLQNKYNI